MNQDDNFGTESPLTTRQLEEPIRDYVAYIRFNLLSVTNTITNAVFSLTKSGGDTLINSRFRVIGLDDVAGNTPQDWSETGLTWSMLGSEINPSIYPSTGSGESPFHFDRVTDFEEGTAGIVETVNSTHANLEGTALAAWLESRRRNGGLATLMVDLPAGHNGKELAYYSREAPAALRPRLTVHCRNPERSGYTAWISVQPVGEQVHETDDPDGDRLSNLAEYALGGNPGDGSDAGFVPFGTIITEEGSNWFCYTYPRRIDAADSGLTYTLFQTTNLQNAHWHEASGFNVLGTGVWTGSEAEFDVITNRFLIKTEEPQFFRLTFESG